MAEIVNIGEFDTREVAIGITCSVLTIISGFILQYTRQFRNMPRYFRINFLIFQKKKLKIAQLAAYLYYLVLLLPLPFFITWLIFMGINHGAYPTVSAIFIGLFIVIMFIPTSDKKFYFKVCAAVICFLVSKMTAIGLNYETSDPLSFYSLTAISLTLNGLFTSLCVWLINSSSWTILTDISQEQKKQIMEKIDIWEQIENPPYVLTGGLYTKIVNMKPKKKYFIIGILYFLGLMALLAYSLIGYNFSIYKYQATVNSVAALTTDIISIILLFESKKMGINPIFNTFGIIIIRVIIVSFTGNFWFAGYCIIFLILIGKIQRIVVDKYYPAIRKYSTRPKIHQKQTNILKTAEFALFILVGMFGGLVIFLANDNQENVIIDEMPLGENSLKFWVVGCVLLLKSASQFFHLISVNIIFRTTYSLKQYQSLYIGCNFCGEYYLFLLLSYGGLLGLGFFLYSKIGANIIWLSTTFLPVFYQFYIIFYTNWKQNDYHILGDVQKFNRREMKKRQRLEKLTVLREQILENIRNDQFQPVPTLKIKRQSTFYERSISAAKLIQMQNDQENALLKAPQKHKIQYIEWRQEYTFRQAFIKGKLLYTDYRIIIGVIGMVLTLAGYSIAFFFLTGENDMTGFTIAVEIIFIIFCFIPVKKYFQTFEKINMIQVISVLFGLIVNYAFGILSLTLGWNSTPVYTVFWAVINAFLLTSYISYGLMRDKGLCKATFIFTFISFILWNVIGIVLLVAFDELVAGIVFIGIAWLFGLSILGYYIAKTLNSSLPKKILSMLLLISFLGILAPMIFGFISETFLGFYGFTITYMTITILIILASFLFLIKDLSTSSYLPNFYSPIGYPIYKYHPQLHTAVQNNKPYQIWLIGWFMFYVFCLVMMVFIRNVHYGISASMLFFCAFLLTFQFFSTYSAFDAYLLKEEINEEIIRRAWSEVCKLREDSILGWFTDVKQVKENLEFYRQLKNSKKWPKNKAKQIDTQSQLHHHREENQNQISEQQLNQKILMLEGRLERTQQNQIILLVNFLFNIKLICKILKKKKMEIFLNFIKNSEDILVEGGIPLLLHQNLYQIQDIYGAAVEQLRELPEPQQKYFYEELQVYKKKTIDENLKKQKEVKKMNEAQEARDKKLFQLFTTDYQQFHKYIGSKKQWQKLKEEYSNSRRVFLDGYFKASSKNMPGSISKNSYRWMRPSADCVQFDEDPQIKLEQSIQINDSHIVNAVSVLDKKLLKQKIKKDKDIPGAYMVQLYKFQKKIKVIIDNQFPVPNQESSQLLFSRNWNQKEFFFNIIEKAYAKLYGSYENVIKGNMGNILAELSQGYSEQILLKNYQQLLVESLFDKIQKAHQQNCIILASSPPLDEQDQISIDGIDLRYVYKIVDAKNFDDNKLIKFKKPFINDSKEYQKKNQLNASKIGQLNNFSNIKSIVLDWGGNSLKWNNRLLALSKYNDPEERNKYFWMSISDISYVFRSVHICHRLDEKWKKAGPFEGVWDEARTVRVHKNGNRTQFISNFIKFPQYGIQVHRECSVVVSLAQKQFRGKEGRNKIFLLMQNNSGLRISSPNLNQLVGISGPGVNAPKISKQFHLKASSYPQIFTLLVGIIDPEETGSFILSVYCNSSEKWRVIENKDLE